MRKYRMQMYVTSSLFLLLLIINGCSKPSESQDVSMLGELEQIVSDVVQGEEFTFAELPWFAQRQQIIATVVADDIESEEENRLVVTGKILAVAEKDVEQRIVYNFENDQFVSGEYWFIVASEKQYNSLAMELKALLTEQLPVPMTNNMSVLDQASNIAQGGEQLIWQGQNNTSFRISLGKIEKDRYVLQIHITAPRPDKKSVSKE